MGDKPVDQLPPPQESEDEKLRKQKTIKIEGFRHPGGWMTNLQIQRILNRCEKFTSSFSRPSDTSEKHIKTGSLDIEFSTVEVARDYYVILQNLIVDGSKTNVHVDPVFFEAASIIPTSSYFTPSEDQKTRACTIYALYLPKSADKQLLECIIGTDVISFYRFLPLPNNEGLIQAEILVTDEETATSLPADVEDFPIDDGEQNTVVKLVNTDDYVNLVKIETAAKPFVIAGSNGKENQKLEEEAGLENGEIEEKEMADGEEMEENEVQEVPAGLAPEIDEDEVLNRLVKHIDDERLNFAEINEKEELYALADVVSEQYGGLPDSLLKPVLLSALQQYLNKTEMHWMREHIEGLIKLWKVEVMSEQLFDRPSIVRMETLDYKPIVEAVKKPKKGAEKRAKAAQSLMGVGAFLQQTRTKLIVEHGEFEMEEDDDGNVLLGGEALSFESWAQKTKTKASGVVRANEDGTKKIGNGGLTRKQLRQARAVEGMSKDEYKQWRKEKQNARRADIKVRIMKRGAQIDEGEEGEENDEEVPEEPIAKKSKDLDEGEIDSEEERKKKKQSQQKGKKKAAAESASSSSSSSSDSNSSSSSSEENEAGTSDARQRRRNRRRKDRKAPRSVGMQPKISPIFKEMFENRKAIIANMSPAHKIAVANVLNQIRQSNETISHDQATKMMNAISSFNGGLK